MGRHAPAEGGERRTRRSPRPAGARGCSDTPRPTPTKGAAKGEGKQKPPQRPDNARTEGASLAFGRQAPSGQRARRGGIFTLPPPQGDVDKEHEQDEEHEVHEDLRRATPNAPPNRPSPPHHRHRGEPRRQRRGGRGKRFPGPRFCDNEQNCVVFSPTKDATLDSLRGWGERGERCSLGRPAPAGRARDTLLASPRPAGARGCSDTQGTCCTGARGNTQRRTRVGCPKMPLT